MRLRDAAGSGRTCCGFSLLEVVIASTLLLVTVTAASATVISVSRAGARLQASMKADRAIRSEAERLRALPYCADSYPRPAAGRGANGPDLVAAVFPHAMSAQNAPAAQYVSTADADGAPAGSFVTVVNRDGVIVRCMARFLASPEGPELGPESLVGWDLAGSDAPPAPTLSVVLSAKTGSRSIRLERSALSVPSLSLSSSFQGSG